MITSIIVCIIEYKIQYSTSCSAYVISLFGKYNVSYKTIILQSIYVYRQQGMVLLLALKQEKGTGQWAQGAAQSKFCI